MCLNDRDIRNIDLYVFGSEGLNVCQSCELSIVEYVRTVASSAGQARLERWRRERAGAVTKESTVEG